ncbi:molecular chaperone [Leminorella grimontii]|uniref:fimbrial biogenesis chaperone n=1 Tax=Leminorella grimontii TaxID=82981 RepID=UPI00321FBB0E
MILRISILRRLVICSVPLILLTFFIAQVRADIAIGGTRVIYPGNKKETGVSISNLKGNDVYLIQSWIEDGDANRKAPFIVTPPLFRINAGEENQLRIIRTGGELPQDRESLFWLSVKAIPAMTESNSVNVLQVVVKSRLKMFYRPDGLSDEPTSAYRQLNVFSEGKKLRIENPTPYFVTFFSLKVNGVEIKEADMLPPKSHIYFTPPGGRVSTVSWQTINDYGGISREEHRQL